MQLVFLFVLKWCGWKVKGIEGLKNTVVVHVHFIMTKSLGISRSDYIDCPIATD